MQVTVEIPDELAGQLELHRQRLSEIVRHGLRKASSAPNNAVEEVFDFLSGRPSPEQIIAYAPSDQAVERLRQLLDRSRAGSITPQEEAELDTLQSLNHLVALIKLQARHQASETR